MATGYLFFFLSTATGEMAELQFTDKMSGDAEDKVFFCSKSHNRGGESCMVGA